MTFEKREKGLFWARFFLLFSVFLLGISLIFAYCAISDARAVSDGVLRLHILADSDSDEEQSLKLLLRDEILSRYSKELSQLTSVDEAIAYFESRLGELDAFCERVLCEAGSSHGVSVSLCREYYPTRAYDGFDLPAGEYTSLRVNIGSGAGQNWFCMVYPPLCVSSSEADEAFVAAGFSESQVRLLTENEEGYTLRFKVVEVVSECLEKLKGWRK